MFSKLQLIHRCSTRFCLVFFSWRKTQKGSSMMQLIFAGTFFSYELDWPGVCSLPLAWNTGLGHLQCTLFQYARAKPGPLFHKKAKPDPAKSGQPHSNKINRRGWFEEMIMIDEYFKLRAKSILSGRSELLSRGRIYNTLWYIFTAFKLIKLISSWLPQIKATDCIFPHLVLISGSCCEGSQQRSVVKASSLLTWLIASLLYD